MNETHQASVRRILVAIDTSPFGSAALDAAAMLATELRAELHGLFIEDINLLRLAGLPFASEIDCSSGICRPLDINAMERALRTKAEGVRQAIATTAQRTSLHWSFRVYRGNVAQTVLAESLEADLLLIGRERPSPETSPSRAQRGPVLFVDEGSPSGDRVSDTAHRLARPHADAVVALVASNEPESERRQNELRLPHYSQRCSYNVEDLLEAARHWRPQLLLIDRSSPLISEASITALVARLPCPLALVQ